MRTLLCSCSAPIRAAFVPRQQLYRSELLHWGQHCPDGHLSHMYPMRAGTHLTGMCTKPGVAGGLALLGALHRSPLACISLKGLAAQGGFQAAYLGVTDVTRVTLSVCGLHAAGCIKLWQQMRASGTCVECCVQATNC